MSTPPHTRRVLYHCHPCCPFVFVYVRRGGTRSVGKAERRRPRLVKQARSVTPPDRRVPQQHHRRAADASFARQHQRQPVKESDHSPTASPNVATPPATTGGPRLQGLNTSSLPATALRRSLVVMPEVLGIAHASDTAAISSSPKSRERHVCATPATSRGAMLDDYRTSPTMTVTGPVAKFAMSVFVAAHSLVASVACIASASSNVRVAIQSVTHLSTRATEPDHFLFPATHGGALRHKMFYKRHFKPAVVAAGLPTKARFHDLRHTCAALHRAGRPSEGNPRTPRPLVDHGDARSLWPPLPEAR